ncbi:MAG: DUF559 domain-containing protein [Nakamurella sp.]
MSVSAAAPRPATPAAPDYSPPRRAAPRPATPAAPRRAPLLPCLVVELSTFAPTCWRERPAARDSGTMHPAISELLGYSGGVIGRRAHPELATRFDSALRAGELVAVLPGGYVHRDRVSDWRALADAVWWWDPRAVIVGESAAALMFWPELTPRSVEVATRRGAAGRAGFAFTRRSIPAELVVQRGGAQIASPALTAIDLVPRYGGEVIDRVLRSRTTTLADMQRALALSGGRRGNKDRRLLLLDSRGEPWSAAERLAHRLLRAGGINAWHANVPIVCDGQKFFMDIAMDHCPVVVEIDGKDHLREDMFEYDRTRGNLLLLAGKQVLHFTWRMLVDEPEWVIATVRRAIDRYPADVCLGLGAAKSTLTSAMQGVAR